MKLIRTLFQATVLLAAMVGFLQPLRADTSDTFLQTEKPFAHSVPITKSNPAHLSTSMILAVLKTGFIGGVVPMTALFLFGWVIWLVVPTRQIETEVIEVQLPAEVPPLRPVPHRRTMF